MPPLVRWSPPPPSDAPLRSRASPEAWHSAVVALASRHGLDGSDARPFASGSDVVFGDGRYVYKLGEPFWREQTERERRWLAHVHGRLGVATPALVAVGELEGWPYTVMEHVPGIPLARAWERLDPSARVRLARRIGALTSELHALPPPPDEPPWEPFAREAVEAARALRRREVETGAVSRELVDEVEAFLAAQLGDAALNAAGGLGDARRVPLHTELIGEHVLVTNDEDPRPSGLIDWADARVGPPEYDVVAPIEFVLRTDRDATRAFLEAWELQLAEANTERRNDRLLAWSLCHRYARLSRLVRAADGAATLCELRERLFPR